MAKRVVVFDNSQVAPQVVVRKKKTASEAAPQKGANAEAVNPKQQAEAPKQAKPEHAPKKAKEAAKQPAAKKAPKPKPDPQETSNKKFRARYLADAQEAAEHARTRMAEKEIGAYNAAKLEFLEKLFSRLEGGQDKFDALAEPFFWNEFKRISKILHLGPTVETPKGSRIAKGWRKAANSLAKEIAGFLNEVRAGRDKYVLKAPPLTSNACVFCMAGTLMYIARDREAIPEQEELRKLEEMYKLVYTKTGLESHGKKLVALIREKNWRPNWANPETVAYLIELVPEEGSK